MKNTQDTGVIFVVFLLHFCTFGEGSLHTVQARTEFELGTTSRHSPRNALTRTLLCHSASFRVYSESLAPATQVTSGNDRARSGEFLGHDWLPSKTCAKEPTAIEKFDHNRAQSFAQSGCVTPVLIMPSMLWAQCVTLYEPSMIWLHTRANHVGSLKTGLYHSREGEWKHCHKDHTRFTIASYLLEGARGSSRSDVASTNAHKWACHVLNKKDVKDGCDEMCKVGKKKKQLEMFGMAQDIVHIITPQKIIW